MLRGIPVVAPYNHSTQDIPSGLFYGMVTQTEEYVRYNEVDMRLGKGFLLQKDDIAQALFDMTSSYDEQVALVPEARNWVLCHSAYPQLRTIVNFIYQKLVNT